jgi:hypothetical protein
MQYASAPQRTSVEGSKGNASTCNTERRQMKYCSEGREVALIAVLHRTLEGCRFAPVVLLLGQFSSVEEVRHL